MTYRILEAILVLCGALQLAAAEPSVWVLPAGAGCDDRAEVVLKISETERVAIFRGDRSLEWCGATAAAAYDVEEYPTLWLALGVYVEAVTAGREAWIIAVVDRTYILRRAADRVRASCQHLPTICPDFAPTLPSGKRPIL
jgi:hypothetical protein